MTDEVRKLAEQSTASTAQIIRMVDTIQRDTETVVKTTAAVHQGCNLVSRKRKLSELPFTPLKKGFKQLQNKWQDKWQSNLKS